MNTIGIVRVAFLRGGQGPGAARKDHIDLEVCEFSRELCERRSGWS